MKFRDCSRKQRSRDMCSITVSLSVKVRILISWPQRGQLSESWDSDFLGSDFGSRIMEKRWQVLNCGRRPALLYASAVMACRCLSGVGREYWERSGDGSQVPCHEFLKMVHGSLFPPGRVKMRLQTAPTRHPQMKAKPSSKPFLFPI